MKNNKVWLRSYLSHPWQQIKYSLMAGAVIGITGIVFNIIFYFKLTHVKWERELDSHTITKVTLIIKDLLFDIGLYSFLCGFLVTFGLIIFITHKFVGPYVSIKRFIAAVLKGENPKPLKVRKNDEVHEIVEMINLLASKMKK